MAYLFENYTGGNAISPVIYKHIGGSMTLAIFADDFGGGNIQLEGSRDGVTWIVINDVTGVPGTYIINELLPFISIASGTLFRAVLDGSTGAVNLNVELSQ